MNDKLFQSLKKKKAIKNSLKEVAEKLEGKSIPTSAEQSDSKGSKEEGREELAKKEKTDEAAR